MERIGRMAICLFVLIVLAASITVQAAQKPKIEKEEINAIIIGDRLASIAYHLGVKPEALVARSVWPAVSQGELSQIERLGCPKNITVKNKTAVPDYVKAHGIRRVLVENTKEFCLYVPESNPMDIIPLLKGQDVDIEVVDFNNGLDAAIRATGKLLNREQEAEALIASYASALARAEKRMPKEKLGKKVLVLNGIMFGKTGNSYIQVEASNGYADNLFLGPMGCENVGNLLTTSQAEISKGYFPLKNMADIAKVNPDIIIVTGASFPVEKAIVKAVKNNPALKHIAALQNHEIYNIPVYIDGSVLDYPYLLTLWTKALYR